MDRRDTTLDEMNAIIEECILQVCKQPEKSVFTLTIAVGSAFSGETISKLKEVARGNTPYVKAGAIVGVTGLYKVVFNAVAMFSKRSFYLFWLSTSLKCMAELTSNLFLRSDLNELLVA